MCGHPKTFLRLPKLLSMMRVPPSQERLRLFLNWKRRSLRQRQRKPQLWKAARKNSQMNYAPDKQLRAYEFQHPTWFINHLKVSKNLHLVNNATYGFRVLAGCRAFLLPHQISTVARCFETTPVRYMLADEVGLGKTVEACSILSILSSENKDLRVLIVVPGALASQWKNELHYKYGLNADINSPRSRICLLSMEDIGKSLLTLSTPWDLAIVDETHRLLANDAWYNQVQSLSICFPE